ncbi:hypothetical protein ALC57_15485, partial [Trachymyrmex cornetzi]
IVINARHELILIRARNDNNCVVAHESTEPKITLLKIQVVIDCSRQNESVKSATVDIRIEFECMENIPLNTTAYCLIIHDRVIEYNPLTNVIRKIIIFFQALYRVSHAIILYCKTHISLNILYLTKKK